MILEDIEKQTGTPREDGFIYPQYDGYCFSNIPSAVQYLFGLRKTNPLSDIFHEAGITPSDRQKVVTLLLDAFGWSQWMRYRDRFEFLSRLSDRGVLAPLTAIFPSVTSPALTTIHSGLTPQEHGLVDASMYFEEIEQLVSTIHFRPVNGDRNDQLLEEGVSPRIMFDDVTVYEKLGESWIPPYILIHDSIKDTAFGSVTMKGGTVVPYTGVEGLTKTLCSRLAETVSPAYFLSYLGRIDIVCHNYGVHSGEYLSQIETLLTALQNDFIGKLPRSVAEETVLIVCADHGHINFDARETIYLNEYPELVKNLRTGPGGEKIPPWGGVRNTFLAVEEGKLDETVDYLAEAFRGRVKVLRSDEAVKKGLFGTGDLHQRFKSRTGDILLLPEDNLTVWYYQPGGKKVSLLGTHGGLTPDEMLVPFAVARISDLQ